MYQYRLDFGVYVFVVFVHADTAANGRTDRTPCSGGTSQ